MNALIARSAPRLLSVLRILAAFLFASLKGELAVRQCFVCLYRAAAGGGPWRLDARLRNLR